MQRAVYYARVSTDEMAQQDALVKQIEECKKVIADKKWKLVGEYVDEGKSGTSIQKRTEYNRLFQNISTDEFDIIVIKSEDRLMRNTKDWYIFIDELVRNKKQLFFYLDNKFYTADDALITGIRAILAEEFSKQLSKKVNNAHKNRQEQGSSISITNNTWGYDKIDKKVVINQEEAEIIKDIYNLCIQGHGSRTISKTLTNKGIKSRSGREFADVTVRKIIRSPLYKGTVIMNQRHYDFEMKSEIKNPEDQWIIHENLVPAIISKEVWEEANTMMGKRSFVERCKDRGDKIRGYHKGKFNLSSKIVCGECGESYWRRKRTSKKGEIIEWKCSTYCTRGRKSKKLKKASLIIVENEIGCDNVHLNEKALFDVLLSIANEVLGGKNQELISTLIHFLSQKLNQNTKSLDSKQLLQDKEVIEKHKSKLLDAFLSEIITKEDYKNKNLELENKLLGLSQRLDELQQEAFKSDSLEQRLGKIQTALMEGGADEAKLYTLIQHTEKIEVFPDHLNIYFTIFPEVNVDIKKTGRLISLEKQGNSIILRDNDGKKVSECSTGGTLDCHK